MKLKLIYLFVLGIFFSCGTREEKIIKEYINENGQFQIDFFTEENVLKKKVVFEQNTKGSNYYINKYDTIENVLIDSIPYVEDNENGKRKEYLIDEKAFVYSVFVNGVEHGKREGFYDSGNKYMIQNVVDGKREGESFFYNINGEIESYEFFHKDERVFIMRYDKEYIDGNPILDVVSEQAPESYFKGHFILPKLDNCIIEVEVCNVFDGEIISCVKLDEKNNNEFYYSTPLNVSLETEFRLPRWKITNSITGKVFEGGNVGYDLKYYKTRYSPLSD